MNKEILSLLKLADNANEDAVKEAIKDTIANLSAVTSERDQLKTEVTNLREAQTQRQTAEFSAELERAIKDGRIDADGAEPVKELQKANHAQAMKLLAGLKPHTSVNDQINKGDCYTDNDMIRVSKMELVGKMTMADTKLDLSKKTFEAFALNTYKINKIELIQGLRFENSKYEGMRRNNTDTVDIKKSKDNWAGSLAVNYLYSDTGNAYVKYERAFTSPAPGQLVDKVETATNVYSYKVNNLKSESTNLFEIGWNDYLFGSLLSADVFYSETKDEIATIFDGGRANAHGTAFRSTNLGKTRRYGFDLSAEQKLEKFTFREAYSFIETKILKDNSKIFEGKHIADVPKHKLVLSVDYNITSKFTVGADYEYRAAAFIDNANKNGKNKAKSVFNLRADYKVTNSLNIYGCCAPRWAA